VVGVRNFGKVAEEVYVMRKTCLQKLKKKCQNSNILLESVLGAPPPPTTVCLIRPNIDKFTPNFFILFLKDIIAL
jgi:hypothetical protein